MNLRVCVASGLIAFSSLFVQYAPTASAQALGTAFTYQGVLRQSGAPLNGTVDLVFTLWNHPTNVAGAQVGSAQAVNGVTVTNGLVQVSLDFGAAAFTGNARWLQIAVAPANGGAGPFTTLSPRQELRATPYALHALNAPLQWTPNGANLNYTSGNVSIGTTSQLGRVTIFPAAGEGGTQTGLYVRNTDTTQQTVVSHFVADSPNGTAVVASVATGGGGANGRAISAINNSASGWAGYFTGRGYFSSDVGIGTTDPQHRLHVAGGTIYSETSNIPIRGRKTGTGTFPGVQGETDSTSASASGVRGYVNPLTPGSNSAGVLGRNFGTNSNGSGVHGIHDGGGLGMLAYSESGSGIKGYSNSANGYGGVFGDLTTPGRGILVAAQAHLLDRTGIGTTAPNSMLHINGATGTNPLRVQNNGVTRLLVHDNGFVMIGSASTPADTLHVAGTTRTNILRIMGGSDLSERFDVADVDETIPQPGMVVCIDPANPGKLIPSTRAYDRTVAGVISGANGINSGMIMGQEGSEADGAYPVALTGRVYVLVDATDRAIEPGDLLTTSDTPGHAMAAHDASRSHGAIIGKAMTALPRGEKGLVLVLVSLQ